MVSQGQGNESRHRILRAAEAEFAEKGFDGSRVDAIATRAEVNKALVYYYFKGKADLLEALVTEYLEGLRAVKAAVPLPSGPQGRMDYGERVTAAFLEYTQSHLDLIRVVLQEELKGDGRPSRLASLWKAEWKYSVQWFSERGVAPPTPPDHEVFSFFFGDLSTLMFLLMNDKWSQAMGRDPQSTAAAFFRLSRAQAEAYWGR